MANISDYFKHIPKAYYLAVLSGIMIGTSYIPMPAWAVLFGFGPLWFAVLQLHTQQASYKKIFFAGWITQFILTAIGFNWIFHVAHEFGYFPWYLSALTLMLFASFMHIYIPLAAVLAIWLIRKLNILSQLIQFLILALVLAMCERIWPSIFEWNLGYTLLWIKFPLYQWADTVGFWGLSTGLLLFQACLAFSIFFWKTQKSRAIKVLCSAIFVLIFFTITGQQKHNIWSKTDSSVQFAIAQGNIGNAEKIQSEKQENFQSYILNVYSELTESHLKAYPQTEIMLWPETALPFALDSDFHQRFLQKSLLEKVQGWNVTLLTGGYSQSTTKFDHLGYPLTRNSVFFIGPHLILNAETYNKTALLVFGEYMPLGKQFPILYKIFPFVGVYERGLGPSPKIIELRDHKKLSLGPQICYESLDSAFSRGLAEKGAQILFNVTNDSWFGWWAEPYQNNTMSLARAIEVRRPLVRATNTGISSAILANGDTLEMSPINKIWTHTYNIPYLNSAPQSFFTRFGHWDWVLWLLILIILLYRGKNVRN